MEQDDCSHDLDFGSMTMRDVRGLTDDETGLPRQITGTATCSDCGQSVDVDYNLAFVDGERK